jgi:Zn-finger nucleic acid-binding protein
MSALPVVSACPQCKDPLVAIEHGDVTALGCRGCGGVWIESDTMARVTYALDPASIAVGEDAATMARMPFPPHAASPPCPTCHAPMSSLTLSDTDVEVDMCSDHGTWFDRGEIQTVVHELMARMEAARERPVTGASASHEPSTSGAHPITPEELRAQMIAQYGVDPSAPPGYARTNAALDFTEGVATSWAVDVGFSLLLSLIGGRR